MTVHEYHPNKEAVPGRVRRLIYKFLIISVIAHIIGLASFGGWVLFRHAYQEVQFQAPPEVVRMEPKKKEYKVRIKQQQRRSARPQVQQRMFSQSISDVALPKIEAPVEPVKLSALTQVQGIGNVLGSGIGSGLGTGMGDFSGTVFSARCTPQERMRKLQEMGGKPEAERAVVKGLRWLASNQNDDGSWGAKHKVAMTGLAVLAFLGHCELPSTPDFGANVTKGIDFLLAQGPANEGYLVPMGTNPAAYEHAIGCYALGEAYALTKDKKIEGVLRDGIKKIVDGQTATGGWFYNYDRSKRKKPDIGKPGGDTSVAGWQVQALKAAKNGKLGGVSVTTPLSRATRFFDAIQLDNGAFGYTSRKEARIDLTGVGILGFQLSRRGSNKNTRKGFEYLFESNPTVDYKAGSASIYRWYYATQACFNEGGDTWERWNAMFQDSIISAQREDGSWPAHGGKTHGGMNANNSDANTYRTALCILMLEIYYRYLPTYEL